MSSVIRPVTTAGAGSRAPPGSKLRHPARWHLARPCRAERATDCGSPHKNNSSMNILSASST
eukprot:3831002-Pyramimonas_sp.AAC.1